jgi:replicative DNA helicase
MIDAAAERAVLAGLFSGGHDALVDVADLLTPECFQQGKNSSYYKVLSKMLADPNSKADVPTFYSVAKSLNLYHIFEDQEEQKFLRALTITSVEQNNVRKLAAKLLKLIKIEQYSNVLSDASDKLSKFSGDESIGQILSVGEEAVLQFSSTLGEQSETVNHISKDLNEYIDYLISNPNMAVGISSGMPKYDEAIGGGLQRSSINVIGARPKTGKTMLADNVALHVAMNLGIPVLNLDTEMSPKEHWHRMLANLSNVESNKIKNGSFAVNVVDRQKVIDASKVLKEIPYHYASIAGQPFEETLSIMRRWIHKHVGFEDDGKQAKPCLVIFDYIKLMDNSGLSKNISEFQALGFLMTGLHNFAVKYDIPILAFAQINRDGINKEDTDVAAGSDRIIWLCSNFSIYKFKSDDEKAAESSDDGVNYNLKLVPIISRHGGGLESGDYINIHAQYKYGKITEGPLRSELLKSTGTAKPKTAKKKSGDKPEQIEFGAD